MVKKINKSKLDSLLNPSAKERKIDEKKHSKKKWDLPKPGNACEAGEERLGWYPEMYADEAQNAKKVHEFRT